MSTRYTARFVPQAWVNDYAITVDAEGDTEWDCTAYVEAHRDYYDRMVERSIFDDEALDINDVFFHDPAAPEWVLKWHGPFDIFVRPEEA